MGGIKFGEVLNKLSLKQRLDILSFMGARNTVMFTIGKVTDVVREISDLAQGGTLREEDLKSFFHNTATDLRKVKLLLEDPFMLRSIISSVNKENDNWSIGAIDDHLARVTKEFKSNIEDIKEEIRQASSLLSKSDSNISQVFKLCHINMTENSYDSKYGELGNISFSLEREGFTLHTKIIDLIAVFEAYSRVKEPKEVLNKKIFKDMQEFCICATDILLSAEKGIGSLLVSRDLINTVQIRVINNNPNFQPRNKGAITDQIIQEQTIKLLKFCKTDLPKILTSNEENLANEAIDISTPMWNLFSSIAYEGTALISDNWQEFLDTEISKFIVEVYEVLQAGFETGAFEKGFLILVDKYFELMNVDKSLELLEEKPLLQGENQDLPDVAESLQSVSEVNNEQEQDALMGASAEPAL